MKDATRSENVFKCDALRRDDWDCNRNARLWDRQREKIYRERHLIKPDAFAAEYSWDENPIQRADNFDDETCHRQY